MNRAFPDSRLASANTPGGQTQKPINNSKEKETHKVDDSSDRAYEINGVLEQNVMRSSFSGCREGLNQIYHKSNEGK